MTIRALCFDLDDTLIWEVPAAHAARRRAAAPAAARYGIDPDALSDAVRRQARVLWYASPMHPYAQQIAVSSWEGLWAPFGGSHPELVRLRAWAPTYRQESWRLALAELGVDDLQLARAIAEAFPAIRRRFNILFDDAIPCLEWARQHYRLALLSNGAGDLQRLKLEGAGLGDWFEQVLFSGDVEVRKPDPEYFRIALSRLSCAAAETVMIGNSLESDIAGAQNAGIRAVWLNRDGADPGNVVPDATIRSLRELPAVL